MTNDGIGECVPLSDGMGLCFSADRNRPCQQATGGLLLSLRLHGHDSSWV